MGPFGVTSPGEELFTELAKRTDALKQFDLVYNVGHIDAQLYALVAFYYLSPERFKTLEHKYSKNPIHVWTMMGCLPIHECILTTLNRIKTNFYDGFVPDQWRKKRIPTKYYILENKKPVKTEDTIEWLKWFEEENSDVANDIIDDSQIITFFQGLITEGSPKLFQTMVIGGQLDCEYENYSTWQEAEAGHKKMVERVKYNL